jgi:hypothetical protein
MATVDHGVAARVLAGGAATGDIATLTDRTRDARFMSSDGLMEPISGHIAKWCKGDGTTTTFTFDDKLPANCLVRTVSVVVSGTSGTAATTVAVGISGTTGKYMAASSFTDSMNAAGVKTVTTIPIHETAARTPIVTFSAAWDSGAKLLVVIHYIKVPAVPA